MGLSHEPCRVCGAATSTLLTASDRNREVDTRQFTYARCRACATVQLDDVPDDLGRYYDAGYHGVPAPAELRSRVPLEAHKLELLATQVAPGRLVEIGPSFGAFALAAREAGYDVTGVEMDPTCCTYLEETVGVRAILSSRPHEALAELPPSRVVAMWHVLEHMAQPVEVLRAAAGNLEPGGVLAIAVPNPDSLGFSLLRGRWAHLDAPRHLHLMALGTLVEQAGRLGLELVATRTADPFARHCNRFGWEYALRRRPAAGPSPALVMRASQALERLLAPVERRGLHGAAYTVLLRRPAAASSQGGSTARAA